ncbi:putative reverse transcriptase domain-containing protein [Tanacetum coccineum]
MEDLQLGIECYQTKLNLEQPNWDASDFPFKEDYTIVFKPRAVIYRDRDDNRKMMRINEVHKFSNGTLTRIKEKLDFMVKYFKLFKFNKGMENRKWTEDDKRRSEDFIKDTLPILLSFTHCGNKTILRVLRIILVMLPEHPCETKVFHNEDGNPARANIQQSLGSFKDGDGDGDTHYERSHKGVKASANSDIVYFFTSAQDGDPLQDDKLAKSKNHLRAVKYDILQNSIRRIRSNQYTVSTGQNSTLLYKSRQMMVPFPSCLDNHYCEEEGNYGPKFTEAYGASPINNTIPRKEKDLGSFTLPCFINDFCFDNALVDLGASVSVMPLSTYLNLGLGELTHTRLIVELADKTVKYPKGIAENVLVGIGKFTFPVDFIILDMPEDIKVPLILERLFLSIARAKIDVYKRKITLRTLVLNRSLDPFSEDYIEINDLNEPFELRRNQGEDLMPAIKEGEVIEEFRTGNEDLDTGIDDYPSYCDDDKKIHIDYAHNLKFSCMIGFEFTHANFFSLLYVNVMSRKFHNSIMENKMVYKGDNVVGALMNVPIFVRTFSVMTDFAVLENMDAYHDDGMGDVIFGEPFLREVGIKTKRFEWIITLYNGNDEVTYQMVRSHPRFKHHTNEQCNKIPPLLKVGENDERNGISHAYQKLKRFYKGVLNLGPDYIRNAKMEEWLTRGHISVHELE